MLEHESRIIIKLITGTHYLMLVECNEPKKKRDAQVRK